MLSVHRNTSLFTRHVLVGCEIVLGNFNLLNFLSRGIAVSNVREDPLLVIEDSLLLIIERSQSDLTSISLRE